jgi:transposase
MGEGGREWLWFSCLLSSSGLDAVRAVLAGAQVKEVASSLGVSRQSVHGWLAGYLVKGVPGLADRSRRPRLSRHQAAGVVEVRVAEMRRQHPRWGAKGIRLELLKKPPEELVIPSTRTIKRIWVRQGLVMAAEAETAMESYERWERPNPMQLWQLDIVGVVVLLDTQTEGAAGGESGHRCRSPFPVLRDGVRGRVCDRAGGVSHWLRRCAGMGLKVHHHMGLCRLPTSATIGKRQQAVVKVVQQHSPYCGVGPCIAQRFGRYPVRHFTV